MIPFDARPDWNKRQRDIYIYNMRLDEVFSLAGANTPADEFVPVLSGDKNVVVFQRDITVTLKDSPTASPSPVTRSKVVLYQVETRLTSLLPRLNTEGFNETSPAISNDGKLIVYVSDQGGHPHLRLYEVSTGLNVELEPANRGFVFVDNPTFSGDGQKIAYSATALGSSEQPGPLDIFLYDLKHGTHLAPPYVNSPFDEDMPTLNQDGTKMVVSSNRFGTFDLFEIDFQTGRLDNLVFANSHSVDELMASYIGEGTRYIYFRAFPDLRNRPNDYMLRLYDRQTSRLDMLPIPNQQLLPSLLFPPTP